MPIKVDSLLLNHKWVECNLPNHEGQYMVFEIDPSRNGAKIQRPDEFKAHWVNGKHLTLFKGNS